MGEGTRPIDRTDSESNLESISEVNTPVRILPGARRPTRPNFLNLSGPSGSGKYLLYTYVSFNVRKIHLRIALFYVGLG